MSRKKVVRDINDDLESYSDDSNDSDENLMKDIKLMILEKTTLEENVFFEKVILKLYSGCLSIQ